MNMKAIKRLCFSFLIVGVAMFSLVACDPEDTTTGGGTSLNPLPASLLGTYNESTGPASTTLLLGGDTYTVNNTSMVLNTTQMGANITITFDISHENTVTMEDGNSWDKILATIKSCSDGGLGACSFFPNGTVVRNLVRLDPAGPPTPAYLVVGYLADRTTPDTSYPQTVLESGTTGYTTTDDQVVYLVKN